LTLRRLIAILNRAVSDRKAFTVLDYTVLAALLMALVSVVASPIVSILNTKFAEMLSHTH
jgi:hypothetical protein